MRAVVQLCRLTRDNQALAARQKETQRFRTFLVPYRLLSVALVNMYLTPPTVIPPVSASTPGLPRALILFRIVSCSAAVN